MSLPVIVTVTASTVVGIRDSFRPPGLAPGSGQGLFLARSASSRRRGPATQSAAKELAQYLTQSRERTPAVMPKRVQC